MGSLNNKIFKPQHCKLVIPLYWVTKYDDPINKVIICALLNTHLLFNHHGPFPKVIAYPEYFIPKIVAECLLGARNFCRCWGFNGTHIRFVSSCGDWWYSVGEEKRDILLAEAQHTWNILEMFRFIKMEGDLEMSNGNSEDQKGQTDKWKYLQWARWGLTWSRDQVSKLKTIRSQSAQIEFSSLLFYNPQIRPTFLNPNMPSLKSPNRKNCSRKSGFRELGRVRR